MGFEVSMLGLPAQSTMGAEHVAGVLAMSDAVLFQNTMTDLGFKEDFKCVPFHIDNTLVLLLHVYRPISGADIGKLIII